jgi:hypothetical protein
MSASRRSWLVGALVTLGVVTVDTQTVPPRVEATSLFGRPLVALSVLPNQPTLEGDLRTAETEAAAKPTTRRSSGGRRLACGGSGLYRDVRARYHAVARTRSSTAIAAIVHHNEAVRPRPGGFRAGRAAVRGKPDEVELRRRTHAAGVREHAAVQYWYLGCQIPPGQLSGAYEVYVEHQGVDQRRLDCGHERLDVDDADAAGRKADAARTERIMPTMDILETGPTIVAC